MILEEAGYVQESHDLMVSRAGLAGGVADVVRALAAGYVRLYRLGGVADINHGFCDAFACDLALIFVGAEVLWGDDVDPQMPGSDGHCVARIEGRYYDAERPEGVARIAELPYFVECAEIHSYSLIVRSLCRP